MSVQSAVPLKVIFLAALGSALCVACSSGTALERAGGAGVNELPVATRLTDNDHYDFHPTWSPDGRHLVYDTVTEDGPSVGLLDVESGASRHLARGDHPVWFPQGGRVVFQMDGEREDEQGVFAVDLEEGEPERLSDFPGFGVPSPDGAWLAYLSEADGDWELLLLELASGLRRKVTVNDANDFDPAWAPDGGSVLFMSAEGSSAGSGGWDVYRAVLGAEGVEEDVIVVTRLTDDPGADTTARWSPDGAWVSFFSDRRGNSELYLMRPDGSEVRRLTGNHGRDWQAWSPDGRWIAYAGGDDEDGDLFVVEVESGQVSPLVVHAGRDVAPDWSPDGGRVAFVSDRDGDLDLYVVAAPR